MSAQIAPYRWGGAPARWLAGIIPDIPTPFDADGAVDLAALGGLCERQIKAGALAVVVCDIVGETATLTPAERDAIIRTAVEVSRKRIHVIAGAGSNSTRQAVENTKQAAAAGADAILSVVPYYNKPMQEGVFAHFRAVAEATALPIILHDCPARTARGLSDDTLARLAQSAQFVGLRDSTADITRAASLRARLPAGFRLLSGDDVTALPFIAAGGDGCCSQMMNVAPELCSAMFAYGQRARWRAARRLYRQMLPLIELLARETPAALKYALSLEGMVRADVRLPLVELDPFAQTAVADALSLLPPHDTAAAGCRLRAQA
ncbi:Dihydrodipicolinate synthase (DHDPS) [Bradyrhizobium sp. STM 3843]|uniref:4-hydroxy-tetrahydrodipicolinate synthase n=1 Tax=Bradyrhizobium sp. STM 3843 TaxID=551947 RepID=UPI00024040A2|nr:4-hydroxy-tetrahydrodipicolinate synthase [Bradyrhizobium sp. STM 3843]CCE11580.1 Dihydrodipicolinate synthase (DHDPS) [Bradyrhizobium sp. STM 3843]